MEAEQFVLGSVLLSGGTVFSQASAILSAEDFHVEKHRRIWGAMAEMAEEGEPIEYMTLATRLMFHGQVESVGGVAYLTSLTDGIPRFENIDAYCKIVKEASERRRIIYLAQSAMGMAYDGAGFTAAEIATKVIGDLVGVGQQALGTQTLREFVQGFPGGVDRLLTPSKWDKGIATGFVKLDEMLTGLHAGELILIGARPSMGKTALGINLGIRAAKDGHRVVMFSVEMAAVAIFHRMICSLARVDSHRFRGGYLGPEERHRLTAAMNQLVKWNFHLNDTAGATVEEIRAECDRLRVRSGPLDLIIIDYLQLLGTKAKTVNRNEEVTVISKALKQLAREAKAPVVALSQLSRGSDQRKEKPRLSDLRESGCLTGDTRITLANGERATIAELRASRPDNGLIVVGQKRGVVGLYPCTNIFSTGHQPVFLLTTKMGRTIRATANHPFWTGSAWARLDELAIGASLPVPVPPQPLRPVDQPKDDMLLLAHLLGNGCLLPNHAAQYTTRHRDLAELVADTAKRIFGSELDPHIEYDNPRKQGGWFQLFFNSTRRHTHNVHSALTEWGKRYGIFGLRSKEKFVPGAVFHQSNAAIAIFLGHLWSTDGHVGCSSGKKQKLNITYSSASKRLIQDVQALLLRLKLCSAVKPIRQGKYDWNMLSVVGGVEQIERFMDTVPVAGNHQRMGRDAIQAETLDRFHGWVEFSERDGWIGDYVREIAPAGREEVFDLTVPDADCFQGNDLIVHNSLEQDADVVLFIYREEVYKPDREDLHGLANLIVAKQRNGPTGTVDLAWLAKYTRFENRAEDYGEDQPAQPAPIVGSGYREWVPD